MPIVNRMNLKKKINVDFVTVRPSDTKKFQDILRSKDIDFTHKSANEHDTTKVAFDDEVEANKIIEIFENIKKEYQKHLEASDPQTNLDKELFPSDGIKDTTLDKWHRKDKA